VCASAQPLAGLPPKRNKTLPISAAAHCAQVMTDIDMALSIKCPSNVPNSIWEVRYRVGAFQRTATGGPPDTILSTLAAATCLSPWRTLSIIGGISCPNSSTLAQGPKPVQVRDARIRWPAADGAL